jgi:hypothetical protein
MSENDHGLAARVALLSDHQSELLLQEVFDQMLADVGTLCVDDEESAYELLAAFISQRQECLPEQVLRPSTDTITYVRRTLGMLAEDPLSRSIIESRLRQLPDEEQMFADPVTAALVLAALVAFLQTKFDISITRKGGEVDFHFGLSKDAASDDVIEKVVTAVTKVGIGA